MRKRSPALLGALLTFVVPACTGDDDSSAGTMDPPDAAHGGAAGTDGSGRADAGGSGRDGGEGEGARDGGLDAGGDGAAPDGGERDTGTPTSTSIEPLVASGSRLTVQMGESGVTFRWFLDTMYDDMPCEFRKLGDTYYCLPALGTASGRYADEDCTEPVAFVDDDPCSDAIAPGQVVQLRGTEACAEAVPVRVGETMIAGPVYSDQSGDCLEVEPEVGTEGAWYPLEPLEASDFVSATEELVDAGDVLVRRLVASDGASLNVEVLTPGGDACVHVRDRCVPGAVAYASDGLHADSDCMGEAPVANATYRCEDEFDYVLRFDQDRECGDPLYEVYEAADHIEEAYRSSGGACDRAEGTFVVAGAPVSDDALLPLRTELVGTGRIRAYATANADGEPLLPASSNPYDTELEANCLPYAFADGKLRCITGSIGNLVNVFTDDECQDAMGVVVAPNECATGEEAKHYLYTESAGACGAKLIERLFEPVPYDGQLYTLDDSAQCMPTTAAPGSEFVAAGDEVSLDRFATLE